MPMTGRIPKIPMPIGSRWGCVVIVREASPLHGARYLVRCDCGAERYVNGTNLRTSPPKSHTRCKRDKAAAE